MFARAFAFALGVAAVASAASCNAGPCLRSLRPTRPPVGFTTITLSTTRSFSTDVTSIDTPSLSTTDATQTQTVATSITAAVNGVATETVAGFKLKSSSTYTSKRNFYANIDNAAPPWTYLAFQSSAAKGDYFRIEGNRLYTIRGNLTAAGQGANFGPLYLMPSADIVYPYFPLDCQLGASRVLTCQGGGFNEFALWYGDYLSVSSGEDVTSSVGGYTVEFNAVFE